MVTPEEYNVEKTPFIVKCLDMSTAHISRKDDELLKLSAEMSFGPVAYGYEYGYFVYTHAWDSQEYFDECNEAYLKKGFSREFIDLLKKARKHGCKYLQLDADGIIYEDLPTFEW